MTDRNKWQTARQNESELQRHNYRQGRFQDFFQGVAETSSGGGENLPGGGEKNLAAPPSPLRFFAFLHTMINIGTEYVMIH